MTLTSHISTHHMPEGGELLLQFKDILCMVHEPNLFCQLTQTSATSTKKSEQLHIITGSHVTYKQGHKTLFTLAYLHTKDHEHRCTIITFHQL
jgi:hypothetical protein